MKSFCIFLFFLLCLNACYAFLAGPPAFQDIKLTANGNFLFYNTPSTTRVGQETVIAYLTNEGLVMVQTVDDQGRKQPPILVHDYKNDVARDKGNVDDHAAPTILYDPTQKRLLLATAYHASTLYIYEMVTGSKTFHLIQKRDGDYSYPRFITYRDDVFLFARKQEKQTRTGDLVSWQAKDGFAQEHTVLKAQSGTSLYAGDLTASPDGILFSYATHYDKERRIRGWTLVSYNPQTKQNVLSCDLQRLLGNQAYSNRPTGIGYKAGQVALATAMYDKVNHTLPDEAFTKRNRVLIAKGKPTDCNTFKLVHQGLTTAPYYHTDVAIDDELNYFYFTRYRYASNLKFKNCFAAPHKMYPQLNDRGLIYAAMNNKKYHIRNFDNSLYMCAR